MNNYHSSPISLSRELLFWGVSACAILSLVAYIYFIYLSAHFSFAFNYEQRRLFDVERAYQAQELAYMRAISTFRSEEYFGKEGFEKIASPVFLSRIVSVALREE